jgi:hypothetical protein
MAESQRPMASEVITAMEEAKEIAWNDHGELAVWCGGYSFNVYDPTRGWQEVDHFTSGAIAGLQDKTGDDARVLARSRMESEGFTVTR